MNSVCGIYKIQSKTLPDRIYIGSAVDVTKRWRLHMIQLSKGTHHSCKLQNHVKKHKIEDLVFSIIEPCFSFKLVDREQSYLNSLKPYFNTCKIAGSALGRKMSDESKRKLSNSRKGIVFTDEHRKKLSDAKKGKSGFFKGHKHSEETKELLRINSIGNTNRRGKYPTLETRRKMSISASRRTGVHFKKKIA